MKRDDKVKTFAGQLIDRKQLDDACHELARIVVAVEKLLAEVEKDHTLTANFEKVAEKLNSVKGLAAQMSLDKMAELADVAEELAVKGKGADKRPLVRKVVGALWDATTTLNHMLDHIHKDTSGEADILLARLQGALKSLGGAREKMSQAEIDKMFRRS